MDDALAMADWDTFEERRAEAWSRGYLRGIGVAAFIEAAGGRAPDRGHARAGRTRRNGHDLLGLAFPRTGARHRLFAARERIPRRASPTSVRLVQGDTDVTPKGSIGTFGSRSSMMGGAGIRISCEKIIAKGTKVAAHLMQAEPEAVTFSEGVLPRRRERDDLHGGRHSRVGRDPHPRRHDAGPRRGPPFEREAENFPNGCHVCEVEVDPDTGVVEIVRYVAVDDCGVVLNPLIVHGQVYGGVAQGLGQAMIENAL